MSHIGAFGSVVETLMRGEDVAAYVNGCCCSTSIDVFSALPCASKTHRASFCALKKATRIDGNDSGLVLGSLPEDFLGHDSCVAAMQLCESSGRFKV